MSGPLYQVEYQRPFYGDGEMDPQTGGEAVCVRSRVSWEDAYQRAVEAMREMDARH